MHDAFVVQVTEGAADLTGEVRHLAHGVHLKGDDLLTSRHVGFVRDEALLDGAWAVLQDYHPHQVTALSLQCGPVVADDVFVSDAPVQREGKGGRVPYVLIQTCRLCAFMLSNWTKL